jgi:putative metallohydrolase (TIGR04338 family)
MSRDAQRGKLYAAEQQLRQLLDNANQHGLALLHVAGSSIPVPIERKFGDLDAVQRYVDVVLARWARKYGVSPQVAVRARQGLAQAHYEPDTQTIAIPPHESWDRSWAMRELVVLHEVAHHLTRTEESHGPRFVAVFEEIIGEFMGPDAGFLFRVLCHDAGARAAATA